MSRFRLTIDHYMSSSLIVISPAQPLSEAIRLMRLHDVRHLPVVSGKTFVGVISQRDIYLIQSLDTTEPCDVLVSEVMVPDPYTVEPDEGIARVAREMVRRKIGTAIVTHGEHLLGLFTTSDALLALAALVDDEQVPGVEATVEERSERPDASRRRPAAETPRSTRFRDGRTSSAR